MHTARSGVTSNEEYAWAAAAHWWGLDYFGSWEHLDGRQQSYLIAVHQTHLQIQAVLDREHAKAMKRQQRNRR